MNFTYYISYKAYNCFFFMFCSKLNKYWLNMRYLTRNIRSKLCEKLRSFVPTLQPFQLVNLQKLIKKNNEKLKIKTRLRQFFFFASLLLVITFQFEMTRLFFIFSLWEDDVDIIEVADVGALVEDPLVVLLEVPALWHLHTKIDK